LNINIFNNKGYINPKDFIVLLNFEPLPVYNIESLQLGRKVMNRDLSRLCEYEYLVTSWRDIISLRDYKTIEQKVKDLFFPYFLLKKSFYDDVGHYIFKFVLLASNSGVMSKNIIGFDIEIRERGDYIANEIKKNNLLYENTNALQIRVGDILVFYMTEKK
jgi:hypothetical protein